MSHAEIASAKIHEQVTDELARAVIRYLATPVSRHDRNFPASSKCLGLLLRPALRLEGGRDSNILAALAQTRGHGRFAQIRHVAAYNTNDS